MCQFQFINRLAAISSTCIAWYLSTMVPEVFSPRQRERAARSGENQSLRGQEEKNEVFLFLPARDSISAPWLRAARSFSAEKNFKKNLSDRGSIVQETSLKKFQWVIYRIRVCFEYIHTNFKLTNQCVFPIFPHVRVTL